MEKYELNSPFFAKEGEKGLNETSAAHLCSLASQIVEKDEADIKNINFLNTYIQIIGSGVRQQCGIGTTSEEINKVSEKLNQIARMNAFISWYAEARKELEDTKRVVDDYDLETYAQFIGAEIPEVPEQKSAGELPALEDVIKNMSIKDRQTYLALEAKAAVLGKAIHPNRSIAIARKRMFEKLSTPFNADLNGRDTIIKEYQASVPVEEVENLYNSLEKEYRGVQQALNHMKSNLRKQLDALKRAHHAKEMEYLEEYQVEYEKYQIARKKLYEEFISWQEEQATQLSRVKFAIPLALEPVVKELNNL
jgi:hypothetical protein